MLVDLHVHTSRYSACGKSSPEEMVERALEVGLDALVFTEHHVIWPERELKALQSAYPEVHIYSGVEIETAEGEDLLVYGVPAGFPCERHTPAADVVRDARLRGGFVTLAHPLRYRETSLDVLNARPDGIEVMSIHVLNYARARIEQIANNFRLLPLASSDAHQVQALGLYAIVLQENTTTLPGILSALRSRRYQLYSDARRISENNALAAKTSARVRELLDAGEDDGTIARLVPGFTAHMVHALRCNVDFMHPLE